VDYSGERCLHTWALEVEFEIADVRTYHPQYLI
jgi:hypothetical protein